MKNLEYYSKSFARGADHAFTDERERLPSIGKSLYEVVRPGSNSQKRAYALLSMVRKSLPEVVWGNSGAAASFRDFSKLPIDQNKYKIRHRVGSGDQCDCFLLESKLGQHPNSLALKVFQNKNNSLEEVEAKAAQVKRDYKVLKTRYQEMPELIPHQESLIIHNFQKPHSAPVLVVLQKFLGNDIKDVATGINMEQWKALCQKNPDLKAQLSQFMAITRENIVQNGDIANFLGQDNLSVVNSEIVPKLVFLDPDGIGRLEDMDLKTRKKVEARLDLLDDRARGKHPPFSDVSL